MSHLFFLSHGATCNLYDPDPPTSRYIAWSILPVPWEQPTPNFSPTWCLSND